MDWKEAVQRTGLRAAMEGHGCRAAGLGGNRGPTQTSSRTPLGVCRGLRLVVAPTTIEPTTNGVSFSLLPLRGLSKGRGAAANLSFGLATHRLATLVHYATIDREGDP